MNGGLLKNYHANRVSPNPKDAMNHTGRLILFFVITLMLFLSSLSVMSMLRFSHATAQEPPLVLAISGEPESLDPHQKRVLWDQMIASQLFDTLMFLEKNMSVQPLLVESWSNPDPLTWIFHIRKNVTFHNGDTLTTNDIIFTFNRIKNRYQEYAGVFTSIRQYSALDDYTLAIETYKPEAAMLPKMENIFIVPEKYMTTVGEEEFSRKPIGTGPYRFVSGDVKRGVTLEANTEYWGGPPALQDAVIKYIPIHEQYTALIQGDADIVFNLTSDEFIRLGKNPDFNTVFVESNMFYYLGMDVQRKKTPNVDVPHNPFREHAVRLAIAKTIDLDDINRHVFNGYAFPATQIGHSGIFGYNPDITRESVDLEEAKRLMQEAGYEDGFSVVLNTPLGTREHIASMIGEQLSHIHIDVTVEPIADKTFWQMIFEDEHEFSFFLAGWQTGHSMERNLNQLFATKSETRGRINFTKYSNPEVDHLISQAMYASNEDDRLQYLQHANYVIMRDKPIIPLFATPTFYGMSKRVDWQPTVKVLIDLKHIKLVNQTHSWWDVFK